MDKGRRGKEECLRERETQLPRDRDGRKAKELQKSHEKKKMRRVLMEKFTQGRSHRKGEEGKE